MNCISVYGTNEKIIAFYGLCIRDCLMGVIIGMKTTRQAQPKTDLVKSEKNIRRNIA